MNLTLLCTDLKQDEMPTIKNELNFDSKENVEELS